MLKTSPKPVIPLSALLFFCCLSADAFAAGYFVGPKVCNECHENEFHVWETSKHAESFRSMQKKDLAEQVLKSVGGEMSMKRNEVCAQCHFTMIRKDARSPAQPLAGPSCEGCHGAASSWVDIHSDYGSPKTRKTEESTAHAKQRFIASSNAGMVWPAMTFDLASNCMSCHGLTKPVISASTFNKMIEAKHPLEPEFEFVRYSQGTMRHRFYPPNIDTNAQMKPAEVARAFIIGLSAKIVSANDALVKPDISAAYKEFQKKRLQSARDAMEKIKGVSEIAQFLSDPTEKSARKLAMSIQTQDLSTQVADILPSANNYK